MKLVLTLQRRDHQIGETRRRLKMWQLQKPCGEEMSRHSNSTTSLLTAPVLRRFSVPAALPNYEPIGSASSVLVSERLEMA